MSQHTITAVRSGHSETMGDWEAEYTITYSYVPGSPDTYDPAVGGPGGWEPGWSAEVEFISIEPLPDAGAFSDLAAKELQDWGADWLDEHYAEAVEHAEQSMQPDPDDARDQRLENERMEREHPRHADDEW